MASIPIISSLDLKYSIIEKFIPNNSKILFINEIQEEYFEYFLKDKNCLCFLIYENKNKLLLSEKYKDAVQIVEKIEFSTSKYKTEEFDFVIVDDFLSNTQNPGLFLKNLCRISKNCIIFFRNQGALMNRIKFLINGTVRTQKRLQYNNPDFWRDTDKWIFSFKDIMNLLQDFEIFLEKGLYYDNRNIKDVFNINNNPNLLGKNFILKIKNNNENKIIKYNLKDELSFV